MKPKKVKLGLEDFIYGNKKKRQIRGDNQTIYRTPLHAKYLKADSSTSIKQYIADMFKNCICPDIGTPPQPEVCLPSTFTLYNTFGVNIQPLTIAISSNRAQLLVANSLASRYPMLWGLDATPTNTLAKGQDATIDSSTPFSVNFEVDDSLTVS